MNSLIWWSVIGPIVAFAFGYLFGGRHTDKYWIDHNRNGLVQCRGHFYTVERFADSD